MPIQPSSILGSALEQCERTVAGIAEGKPYSQSTIEDVFAVLVKENDFNRRKAGLDLDDLASDGSVRVLDAATKGRREWTEKPLSWTEVIS